MYSLLIKLMITAALLQLGVSLDQYLSCNSKACTSRIEKASRDVLRVNWKPISMFPKEAKKFK